MREILYVDFKIKEGFCVNSIDEPTCRTSAAVEKVLDSLKVVIMLNHERFSSDTYDKPCVIQETEFKIFDIPTLILRRDFGITFTTVELDDNRFMALSGLTN